MQIERRPKRRPHSLGIGIIVIVIIANSKVLTFPCHGFLFLWLLSIIGRRLTIILEMVIINLALA